MGARFAEEGDAQEIKLGTVSKKTRRMSWKNLIGGLLLAAVVLSGAYDRLLETVRNTPSGTSLPETAGGRMGAAPPVRDGALSDPGLPVTVVERSSLIIRHLGYTVSYNADTRIANWVAWTLTPDRFEEVVSRYDKFLPDPEVGEDAVTTEDYTRSGYDRGHLCPAADNKWDKQAMRESFYMTNVCPQNHNLNRGDWKELEESCRRWAQEEGRIYIVCGPILYDQRHRTIGKKHKITVPEAFFKVVLCADSNPPKAIGFIYKNASGNHPLDSYVNTVDEVERITGIDFFPALPDEIEEKVETEYDLKLW